MNDQTINTEKKRGIVTNFAAFTPTMLHSMKYDVGLYMTEEQLANLRRYYRSSVRRDPSLDELYLLDRMIQLRGNVEAPITTLSTDSDVIAQTYADVMKKRKAILAQDTPPTLKEIQQVASKYLKMIGKPAYLGDTNLFSHGSLAKAELILNGCRNVISDSCAAMGTYTRGESPAAGDLLIVVLPQEQGDFANLDQNELASVFTCRGVKGGTVIGNNGIIDIIRQVNKGAYIDTTALPIAQPCELTDLCDACHGAILVIVSHEQSSEFIANAKQLRTFVIGSLTSDNKLTVNHARTGTVSHSIAFLNSLAPSCEMRALLCETYPSVPVLQSSKLHVSFPEDRAYVFATRKISYPKSPFWAAMNAALQSISDCVAQGADYQQVCLSSNIQQPSNTSYANQILEGLLGIYRAQMELCITDCDSTVGSDTASDFSITVCAAAPLPQHTNQAPASTSTLYLLNPKTQDNGLPCFEELRRMWNYVSELVKDGKVISARAVTFDGINATIPHVIGNNQSLCPCKAFADELSTTTEHGAILLLSASQIDGIPLGTLNNSQDRHILQEI